MKRFLIASFAVAMMAHAAEAGRLQFVGTLKVTAATPTCASQDETSVGTIYKMRLNPPDTANADPRFGLSIIESGGSGAQNYKIASGFAVGVFKNAALTSIYRFGGSGAIAPLKITSSTPLAATAQTVTLRGEIQDFDGLANCDISFLGVGVLMN